MLKRRPSYCSDDGLLLRAEVRAVARLGHVAGLGTVGNDDDGDRDFRGYKGTSSFLKGNSISVFSKNK